MKLVVELTEMEVSHLGRLPRVIVRSLGAPNKEFSGIVAARYPKANPLTRRVLVEILIDNPNLELRSNTFADCTIESELAEEKLLIPAKGVIHDYGQSYCYVASPSGDGSLVERRVIETHAVANLVKVVEVVHGLQDGDLVILSGQRELRPGQTVATHPVTLGEDKLVSTTREDKD
jgi:multidrug efflux pump subunit AcrA (membrane-fusion protein)